MAIRVSKDNTYFFVNLIHTRIYNQIAFKFYWIEHIIQTTHPIVRRHLKQTVARFTMRLTARKRSYDSNATVDVYCMVDRTFTVYLFQTMIKTRVSGMLSRLILNRNAVLLLFLLQNVLLSVRSFNYWSRYGKIDFRFWLFAKFSTKCNLFTIYTEAHNSRFPLYCSVDIDSVLLCAYAARVI